MFFSPCLCVRFLIRIDRCCSVVSHGWSFFGVKTFENYFGFVSMLRIYVWSDWVAYTLFFSPSERCFASKCRARKIFKCQPFPKSEALESKFQNAHTFETHSISVERTTTTVAATTTTTTTTTTKTTSKSPYTIECVDCVFDGVFGPSFIRYGDVHAKHSAAAVSFPLHK